MITKILIIMKIIMIVLVTIVAHSKIVHRL